MRLIVKFSRYLNLNQRQIFDFIFNCAKLQVKVKSGIISNQSKPFHLFLSGSGGCGKSHLIKTIYKTINKVFLYRSGDPRKPRVLHWHRQMLQQSISMAMQNIRIDIYPAEVRLFHWTMQTRQNSEIRIKKWSLSLLIRYQWFQVNYFIRYLNV